jgi:serine/threonine protein phosphatase PrpC
MNIYSFSGKGKRKTNEDHFTSIEFDNHSSLHIIADGMGGYQYGEVASRTAVETFINYFSEKYSRTDIELAIRISLSKADEAIQLKQNELHEKLGTTIAGTFIQDNTTYAFWLGDVQIYHFRNQELLFVSESHSLINEMKNSRTISIRDIERYKNIVTKTLSGTLKYEATIVSFDLQVGDTLLICSDGLYREIDISRLANLSNNEINKMMIEAEACIEDNYTLIKIDM